MKIAIVSLLLSAGTNLIPMTGWNFVLALGLVTLAFAAWSLEKSNQTLPQAKGCVARPGRYAANLGAVRRHAAARASYAR